MKGKPRSEQTKKIFKMFLKGKTSVEIQAKLGVSQGVVAGALARGREAGVIPPKRLATPLDQLRNSKVNRGNIADIINGLDDDQQMWLIRNTVDLRCTTISEFILEIVRDCYFDEKEKS